MLSDDITLTDSAGNATYRRITNGRTDGTVRYDTGASVAEPSSLTIAHQEVAPKGQAKSTKHLISVDKTLVNSTTGVAEKAVVNITISHPSASATFEDADIQALVDRAKSLLTSSNVPRLLHKES
jgi:hypothetical protein